MNYKTIKCYRHDPPSAGPEIILNRIKTYLAAGHPAMSGFTVYSSIEQASDSAKIALRIHPSRTCRRLLVSPEKRMDRYGPIRGLKNILRAEKRKISKIEMDKNLKEQLKVLGYIR